MFFSQILAYFSGIPTTFTPWNFLLIPLTGGLRIFFLEILEMASRDGRFCSYLRLTILAFLEFATAKVIKCLNFNSEQGI